MSASYVGGSGSNYGSSSSGFAGGSSALTQSILGSVALAGENVALRAAGAPLATPVYATPVTRPTIVSGLGGRGSSSLFLFIVIAFIAFFAYEEL